MLVDAVEVRHIEKYRLWLRFDDGKCGEVDLEPHLQFRNIFEPLRDPEYFVQVSIDPEAGTIVWPNGADVDPIVLYSWVTGQRIEEILNRAHS